jgi:hypothetical protein
MRHGCMTHWFTAVTLTDYHVVQVHKSAFINCFALWLKHMCTFYLIVKFSVFWLFDRTTVPSRMQKVSESASGSCVMWICFCTLEELQCKTLVPLDQICTLIGVWGVGETCTCLFTIHGCYGRVGSVTYPTSWLNNHFHIHNRTRSESGH